MLSSRSVACNGSRNQADENADVSVLSALVGGWWSIHSVDCQARSTSNAFRLELPLCPDPRIHVLSNALACTLCTDSLHVSGLAPEEAVAATPTHAENCVILVQTPSMRSSCLGHAGNILEM